MLHDHIKTVTAVAEDKHAEDIVVLDVREVCNFTDTLVICHGKSVRQAKTIAEAIRDALREEDTRPHHIEGERAGEWILLDYLSFVVHVFVEERRRFYALDKMWGDALRIEHQDGETDSADDGDGLEP